MASQQGNNISIAILDDNFAVRQSLKLLIHRIIEWVGFEPHIYSAADGVEGIGYTLVTVPNIIVIDTTLPRYSGREVIEYLRSNDKFINQQIKVLVIYDGDKTNDVEASHFKYLNKQDRDFVKQLESHLLRGLISAVGPNMNQREGRVSERFLGRFLRVLIWLGARADVWKRRSKKTYFLPLKFIQWLVWLAHTVIIDLLLVVIYIFIAKPDEINEVQARQDEYAFRMRVYPLTFISMIVGWFLLLQFITFLIFSA